jgi:DALR anticodon binding domain
MLEPEELADVAAAFDEVTAELVDKGIAVDSDGALCVQTFSAFFEACPVLRADTAQRRGNRAALVRLTGDTLSTGLGLLGLEAPHPL